MTELVVAGLLEVHSHVEFPAALHATWAKELNPQVAGRPG